MPPVGPPADDRDAPPRPKYQQVRDHLFAEIKAGRFALGASLPPESELVRSLGLSRYTVRQALSELENEGMISRTRGRGTVVTSSEPRKVGSQPEVFVLIAPELHTGFYPSLVQGFEQASSAFQSQVIVSSSNNDTTRQGDLVLQMIDRSVGGVAIVPTTTTTTPAYQMRQLQQHGIPVVFCHRVVPGVSAPCITWSGYRVGKLAGEAFREQGHTRVAAMIDLPTPLAKEYVRGLREAVTAPAGQEQGEFVVCEFGTVGVKTIQEGIRQGLTTLFSASERPTALFCGNTGHAEQIYLQAEEFGLKIPQDISLIAFGGTWRGVGLAERITSVAVDECAIGAKAAELLREMRAANRPFESTEVFEFPVTMLSGQSLGPASGKTRWVGSMA